MSMGTVELMHRGMHCLVEHMGEIDAQRFISAILREKFDYTQWRRERFDNMTLAEFEAEVTEWAKTHPGVKGSYVKTSDEDAS